MKAQFKSELFIAIRLGPLIFSLLENVGNQWFSHWRQFKTDISLQNSQTVMAIDPLGMSQGFTSSYNELAQGIR